MRKIPLQKAFQRLMWTEMERDPEWAERMDAGTGALPTGPAWPTEVAALSLYPLPTRWSEPTL